MTIKGFKSFGSPERGRRRPNLQADSCNENELKLGKLKAAKKEVKKRTESSSFKVCVAPDDFGVEAIESRTR